MLAHDSSQQLVLAAVTMFAHCDQAQVRCASWQSQLCFHTSRGACSASIRCLPLHSQSAPALFVICCLWCFCCGHVADSLGPTACCPSTVVTSMCCCRLHVSTTQTNNVPILQTVTGEYGQGRALRTRQLGMHSVQ